MNPTPSATGRDAASRSGRSAWVITKRVGRVLTCTAIVLFFVHAFLYVTRGTVYFLPPIIAVEAILKTVPYGDTLLQWLLFPKSFEGLNRVAFAILNHLPIWVFVGVIGVVLWVAGWLKTRSL